MDRSDGPPLLDKLGIGSGTSVCIRAVEDEAFLRQLHARIGITGTAAPADADVVVLGVATTADLEGIERLAASLKPTAALWIIRPKGQPHLLKEIDVLMAGRAAGLVDIKIVRFSEIHTGHKFVVPVARRPRSTAPRRAR